MIRWLLDLLFPPRCILCHKLMESSRELVCDSCGRFVLTQEPCVRSGKHFTRCAAPFRYRDAVRDSIRRYKFAGRRFYAKTYGLWLAALIRREFAEFDIITWVPVSRRRLRKRGYDQAKELCFEAAAHLNMEPTACLRKIRNNPAQSSLVGAENRKKNVAGAYVAVNPEQFRGKRVLLVDDIMTTGATLEECSCILRRSGADTVMCAALAATE